MDMLKVILGVAWLFLRVIIIVGLCVVGGYCLLYMWYFPFLWEGCFPGWHENVPSFLLPWGCRESREPDKTPRPWYTESSDTKPKKRQQTHPGGSRPPDRQEGNRHYAQDLSDRG